MTRSSKRAAAGDVAAAIHSTVAAVAGLPEMSQAPAFVPWDDLLDDIALYAWQPALRFALDCERASERCDRRACKSSGRCHMKVKEGKPLDCGASLSDEALVSACRHVAFGCEMLLRFCEDFELVAVADITEDRQAQKRPARGRKRSEV